MVASRLILQQVKGQRLTPIETTVAKLSNIAIVTGAWLRYYAYRNAVPEFRERPAHTILTAIRTPVWLNMIQAPGND